MGPWFSIRRIFISFLYRCGGWRLVLCIESRPVKEFPRLEDSQYPILLQSFSGLVKSLAPMIKLVKKQQVLKKCE